MSLDYLIIGGGTAGISLYKSLKSQSLSVKLVDDNSFTTTCARVGCMPSKLLIAAAEACANLKKANLFGIEVDSFKVNSQKVMQRVQSERDRFLGFIENDLDKYPEDDFIKAKAKFLNDHEVILSNGDKLSANKIIIATGSKAFIPKVFVGCLEQVLTSDNIFDLKSLPESVAVIGSGIIGLELGQALAELGVRVKIISRSSSLNQVEDKKIQEAAKEIFSSKLDIEFDSEVKECSLDADKFNLVIESNKSKSSSAEVFDQVLVAAGRIPNLDSLDLQKTSLAIEDKMPRLSEDNACLDKNSNASNIYMIGDVRDVLPVLHLASYDAKALSKVLLSKAELEKPVNLSISFTSPQMMKVGLTIKQLKKKAIDFDTGEARFENQGRSRMFLVNEGMLRVYFEKESRLLLGAEMCGPDAEYFGHFLALAIKNKETRSSLLEVPYYHPTIMEALKTALK